MDKFTQTNLTGAAMSPFHTKEMLRAVEQFPADLKSNQNFIAERIKMIQEADTLGTIPLPGSIKGAIKNTVDKALGGHPGLFLNKLSERLAFERTGVRLYEAALAKAKGLNRMELWGVFTHIQAEEQEHMTLVLEAIKELGGDPTAMTPDADLTGVLGMGMIQSLTDPRTSIAQILNTLLIAEMTDNAAWELLIELSSAEGHETLTKRFLKALQQEEKHLLSIKTLYKNELELPGPSNTYYVLPAINGGWNVKKADGKRISGHFANKREAIATAHKWCKINQAELFIIDN